MSSKKIIKQLSDSTDSNSNSNSNSDSDSNSNSSELDQSSSSELSVDDNVTKKTNQEMLDIVYGDIDDTYAKATYGPFDVIMMKRNGYINATKFCEKAKKDINKWMNNKTSKNIIKCLSKSTNEDLTIKIKNGNTDTGGIYVHPDLIIHIARWCSAEFAVKVSDIVNNYLLSEATKKKDKEIAAKKVKISELKEILEKFAKEAGTDIKTLVKENKKISNKLTHVKKDLVRKDKTLKTIRTVVQDTNRKLDIKADNSVIKKDTECLAIVRNYKIDDVSEKYIEKHYQYKVYRIKKNQLNNQLKRYKDSYPDNKKILEIDSPNAVNLWNRCVDKLGKKIKCSNTYFDLGCGLSEKRFMKVINDCHDERLDVDDL
jgi:hypothetical protein